MIFKQYTLNGKRRVSNGKRHVIKCKQTREKVCGLCLNANSCILINVKISLVKRWDIKDKQSISAAMKELFNFH